MSSAERVLLPTASPAQTWKALREMLHRQRLRALGAAAVLVLAAALGLAGPAVLGAIVNAVITGEPASAVTWLAAGLLLAVAAQAACTAAGQLLVAQVGETSLADLREEVVERAVDVPLAQLETAGTGDLVARVVGDVRIIGEAVSEAIAQMAGAALTIVLTVVGLGVLDWRYAVAGALAIPIQVHTLRWYLRVSGPIYAAERVAEGARAQQLLDTVGGGSTVRALSLTAEHIEQVRERSLSAIACTTRTVRLSTRFFGRLNIAEFVGLSALLVTGFFLVRDGQTSVGAATTAALYFHRIFDPINTVLGMFDRAQAAAAGLARLVGIAQLSKRADPDVVPDLADSSLVASGVGHAYVDGQSVLSDVDLSVAHGQRVALVGASGAGKTTLATILAGIHHPTLGAVHIGSVPMADLGPTRIRQLIALVTQEVHVFVGSLAADLRLARPNATDAEVEAALAAVGAADWVSTLPEKTGTIVGEGGFALSATQSQQVALARLILADPPVVILDEATAEAGSAGARTLERAAERALAGRTALIVAHRLSQAVSADHIVVLEAGRIVQQGYHDELVAAAGPYRDLWVAWAAHREESPGEK